MKMSMFIKGFKPACIVCLFLFIVSAIFGGERMIKASAKAGGSERFRVIIGEIKKKPRLGDSQDWTLMRFYENGILIEGVDSCFIPFKDKKELVNWYNQIDTQHIRDVCSWDRLRRPVELDSPTDSGEYNFNWRAYYDTVRSESNLFPLMTRKKYLLFIKIPYGDSLSFYGSYDGEFNLRKDYYISNPTLVEKYSSFFKMLKSKLELENACFNFY
ncbi:MAG: hypothetical protein A2487_18800 [Candidatus Raymondbacteria bacterium RifOxyC12_full_50_8]|nr:MAG: hypothetical protein A2487_18800 [Candidatus Raymondbacteria bacterium RifOxyC12_full_50_8]